MVFLSILLCRIFKALHGMKIRWIMSFIDTWRKHSAISRTCASWIIATFVWGPSRWAWTELLVPLPWGVGKPNILFNHTSYTSQLKQFLSHFISLTYTPNLCCLSKDIDIEKMKFGDSVCCIGWFFRDQIKASLICLSFFLCALRLWRVFHVFFDGHENSNIWFV